MKRTLLIGYGNPLRSDDAIGWTLAGILSENLQDQESVSVIQSFQLTPEMAESISHADKVVFMDASCEGNPGTFQISEVTPDIGDSAWTHHMNPSSLLKAAEALYNAAPRSYLLAISGKSFEYGETLSPELEEIIPNIIRHVDLIIADEPICLRAETQ